MLNFCCQTSQGLDLSLSNVAVPQQKSKNNSTLAPLRHSMHAAYHIVGLHSKRIFVSFSFQDSLHNACTWLCDLRVDDLCEEYGQIPSHLSVEMLRFVHLGQAQFIRGMCTMPKVAAASLNQSDRMVTLSMTDRDNKRLKFPLAWLRDNCRCSTCHNTSSDLRNLKMLAFNPRLRALSADLSADGAALEVSWEDGHSSSYQLEWLRSVAFDSHSVEGRQRLPQSRHSPLLWCDSAFTQPDRVQFDDLMENDSALLKALLELERRGLVLMSGCGLDRGAVKRLCDRIAFPRITHYGDTFEMRTEAQPRNLGYTTDRLDYHTDLPYLHEQPGVQALLCLRQAPDPGGDSLFADGFSAAELIRRRRPDLFRLLTGVPVRFRDRSTIGRFDLIATHSTVELEEADGPPPDGCQAAQAYRRVHFSNQQRDLLQSWPLADVQSVYDALKAFSDVVEGHGDVAGKEEGSEAGSVRLKLKLQPGEMALFDNSRLLHSRTAFTGQRHLAGAYMLWDDVLSRRRVLEGV